MIFILVCDLNVQGLVFKQIFFPNAERQKAKSLGTTSCQVTISTLPVVNGASMILAEDVVAPDLDGGFLTGVDTSPSKESSLVAE